MKKHKGSLTGYYFKLQQHHLPLEGVIPIFNQPRGIPHPAQKERTNVSEAESKWACIGSSKGSDWRDLSSSLSIRSVPVLSIQHNQKKRDFLQMSAWILSHNCSSLIKWSHRHIFWKFNYMLIIMNISSFPIATMVSHFPYYRKSDWKCSIMMVTQLKGNITPTRSVTCKKRTTSCSGIRN